MPVTNEVITKYMVSIEFVKKWFSYPPKFDKVFNLIYDLLEDTSIV